MNAERAGELFTVIVGGPGRLQSRVLVRAEDEEGAALLAAAQGHAVKAVLRGEQRGELPRQVPVGVCGGCGYSLRNLPSEASKGVVQCPECGHVNLPQETAPPRRVERVRRRWIFVVGLLLLVFAALLVMEGMLRYFGAFRW